MKGHYHERLRAALRRAVDAEGIAMPGLAAAIESDDPTGSGIGRYIRGDSKAGALDLDAADRALAHCGLFGLREFVTGTTPPDTGIPPRVIAFLSTHSEFRSLLTDLLDVPPGKHAEVLSTWEPIVRGLRRKPRAAKTTGTSRGRRTREG